jgi:hypothetical protein
MLCTDRVRRLQERGYAVKDANHLFEPTPLGEALIGAYDRMGLKEVYEYVMSPLSCVYVVSYMSRELRTVLAAHGWLG